MPCKGCSKDCKCSAEKCGDKCDCGSQCKCHCKEGHDHGKEGHHGECKDSHTHRGSLFPIMLMLNCA
ncbi:hypothetical protein DOY81_013673 [Sarcophaga bullata]|nr:hypothetical protein DOY81_013673 [Sarcophaga bullata]